MINHILKYKKYIKKIINRKSELTILSNELKIKGRIKI